MGLPGLTFHAAFGHTIAEVMTGAAITWEDITEYVRASEGATFSRGREDNDGNVTVQTGDLVLDNPDGRFTPGKTDGAYGDVIKLRVPIQLRTTVAAVSAGLYDDDVEYDSDTPYDGGSGSGEIDVWTGSVDEWDLGWRGGHLPLVHVTMGDNVAQCQRTQLEALPVQVALAQTPVWCYPLDEPSSSAVAADRTGNIDAPELDQTRLGASGTPTITFGSGYSPGSVADSAEATVAVLAPHDTDNGYYLHSTGVPAVADPADGSTIHVMVLPSTISRDMGAVRIVTNSGQEIRLGINSAGKATAWFSTTGATITGTTVLTTADWAHIALTQETTSSTVTAKLWVNGGAFEASTTWDTETSSLIGTGTGTLSVGVGAGTETWDGNICNVTAHKTALTEAVLTEIAGGRDGWDGDRSVQRAYRIARAAGLSDHTPTGTAATLGQSVMSSQYTKDKTAVDAFNDCATAEASPWWVNPSGRFTMVPRSTRQDATSAFTLKGTDIDPGTGISLNDENIVNEVEASRPGGAETIVRKNAESVAAYGPYRRNITAYLQTDNDLAALAELHAFSDAEPAPRTTSLTTDLHVKAATLDTDTIHQSDIGTLLTVTDLPTATSPATTQLFFIEGTKDTVTKSGWTRTWNVSRGDRWQFWALDESLLDEDTILGF